MEFFKEQSVSLEKMAVFFDLENLPLEDILPNIFSEFENRGFIVHPRKLVFNNVSQIKKGFLDKNIKLYHLDLVGAYAPVGKNVADFRLYIEVLDLLYKSPDTRTYCIVSGDADYAELVIKLRNENRYVIGIGPKEKMKVDYVALFNEFIYTEDLKKKEVIEQKEEIKEIVQKPKKAKKTIIKVEEKEVIKEETKETKSTSKKTKAKKKESKPKIEKIKTFKEKDKTNDFYQVIKDMTQIILDEKKEKGQKEIFCSALIKELKDRSPDYLGKFKINYEDLQKADFSVSRKTEDKPESSFIEIETLITN